MFSVIGFDKCRMEKFLAFFIFLWSAFGVVLFVYGSAVDFNYMVVGSSFFISTIPLCGFFRSFRVAVLLLFCDIFLLFFMLFLFPVWRVCFFIWGFE